MESIFADYLRYIMEHGHPNLNGGIMDQLQPQPRRSRRSSQQLPQSNNASNKNAEVTNGHQEKSVAYEVDRRKLYEISDDPLRKEFLDDLFSFMQKKGTPINRLPIMAKSVLDLFELYNLVIARGGLVEVINKKLWQEIIKGLRLPSSITSAAFTLRTQYMKYLYDYECEKKNLSTRSELDAAIEGNKREGRRSSGQYDPQSSMAMPHPIQRNVPATFAAQFSQPLGLALSGAVAGLGRLPPLPHTNQMPPHEIEYRMREYMKIIQQHQLQQQHRDFRRNGSETPSPPAMVGGISPQNVALLEASRLGLWSHYYSNGTASPQPQPELEPQREALNLSDSPNSNSNSTPAVKREACRSRSPPPPAKRRTPRPPSPGPAPAPVPATSTPQHNVADAPKVNGTNGTKGAAFKIKTRGDAATGDQQLVVSIEINGVTYEGVLFPTDDDDDSSHTHTVS